MMYRDCPPAYRSKMIAATDMVVGECVWRRRFVRRWIDHGLDAAYGDWLAKAPKRVPEFLPQVADLVKEIKECRLKPFQPLPPPPALR